VCVYKGGERARECVCVWGGVRLGGCACFVRLSLFLCFLHQHRRTHTHTHTHTNTTLNTHTLNPPPPNTHTHTIYTKQGGEQAGLHGPVRPRRTQGAGRDGVRTQPRSSNQYVQFQVCVQRNIHRWVVACMMTGRDGVRNQPTTHQSLPRVCNGSDLYQPPPPPHTHT
jgi:hypothetical protein